MKKRSSTIYCALLVLLSLNLVVGYMRYRTLAELSGKEEGYHESMELISSVTRLIHKNYFRADQVHFKFLKDGALLGMVGSLDQYSGFVKLDDFKGVLDEAEGEYTGIGLILTADDSSSDSATVHVVAEAAVNLPASIAGVQPGDQIVSVNGEDVTKLTTRELADKIKGKKGTEVKIVVKRPETNETLTLIVERAVIPIETIRRASILEPGIAYLLITEFNKLTNGKLEVTIKDLMERGNMHTLILDLRHNPGGVMESAVEICSLFLDAGKLVMTTTGRDKSREIKYMTRKGTKFLDLKLIILINEMSASAAEIVAGCLVDQKRAVLVGEKTYGKAYVQSIFPLSDGSGIKLTTAEYLTESRKPIHGKGVEPTVVVKISDADSLRLWGQRIRLKNHKKGKEKVPDIVDFQLEKALELARKNGTP